MQVDPASRPKGEIFFWPLETTANFTMVEYVLVHSAEWFAAPNRIQAFALHRQTDDSEPTRANLVIPLYCNVDVPWQVTP